ncbi:MAG: ATP phosphoribosyltransferase regulatory subunit [Pseudohongiellaceae bacterium]
MTDVDRWLLPDGVDEVLPPQANKLETLRRDILDLYAAWGYDLVVPPLIEFLDSLFVVQGESFRLDTFKIVDQFTGRGMGIRADITSQVARIDAHGLKRNGPNRLCYADSVLHTKPSSLRASRCPIRIGAELYGSPATGADIEVISIMLETLAIAGINKVQLALGHVGIYRSLIESAGLDAGLEQKLFNGIQRKSTGEIESLLSQSDCPADLKEMLQLLPGLSGDIEVLAEAEQVLASAPGTVKQDIARLRNIAASLEARFPEQSLYFDLSELRGYEYHTGIVFAAYIDNYGEAVAKGGRYDDIGEMFGRYRSATGFDADLKTLLQLGQREYTKVSKIFAPAMEDPALLEFIRELRKQGKAVVTELEDQKEGAAEMDCSSIIVQVNGKWVVQPL